MRKYAFITDYVRDLIVRGIIRRGAKLPSIRRLAHQWGFSPITVQHAYELLVAEGLIVARPRSGYVVAGGAQLTNPVRQAHTGNQIEGGASNLAWQLGQIWQQRKAPGLGGVELDPTVLQLGDFSRLFRSIIRKAEVRTATPLPIKGHPALRDAVARRLAARGVTVGAEDVVITGPGIQGVDLCLELVAAPGDSVIAETPNYPPLLLALRRRGLRVIELYSHPQHGVDPDQVLYLLANHRIKLAVLAPVNHFPTGVSTSPEVRERLARIIESHDVPVLEYDVFSDLTHRDIVRWPIMYYGAGRRHFLVGSFRPVLGTAFGLGWIVYPQDSDALSERKFMADQQIGDAALEAALAEYLGQGGYDKELSRLRRRLALRSETGLRRLSNLLPAGFNAPSPIGGYMSWMRGPSAFDSVLALRSALAEGLSFAPGPLFSPSGGFANYIGINLTAPWVDVEDQSASRLMGIFAGSVR